MIVCAVISVVVSIIARATFELSGGQAIAISLMLFLVFAGISSIVHVENKLR